MLPLLVTVLLEWSEPGTLVGRLADDSIERRERAAEGLHRWGPELRPFLLDTREASGDPEIRARVDGVLARLAAEERIRWFGGANRVAGFGVSLRSDWSYGSGPFRLTVEVMNVGPKDQIFPGIKGWDLELPDQELRSSGSEAKLTVRRTGGPLGFRRTSWASGERSTLGPAFLRPGDSARFEMVLDARNLQAGDYQVALEVFAAGLGPDADEHLRTNQVHLTIRK